LRPVRSVRRRANRPAVSLLMDVLDGVISWDGRLWTTVRRLYAQPGAVTRAYLDGKRACHTPPFRLYVIALFVFIAAISASGITVIGVHITYDDEPAGGIEAVPLSDGAAFEADGFARAGIGEFDVSMTLFRPPWEPAPEAVDLEALRAERVARAGGDETDIPALEDLIAEGGPIVEAATTIMRDPESVERRISLALSQAVLSMVAGFALLNLVLHPRAPLITHLIHTLHFHAALLPFIAVAAIVSMAAALASEPLSAGVASLAVVMALVFTARADRAVYASSLFGAILRTAALFIGYLLTFLAVTVTLSLLLIA
jgi:hypothetical protein